MKRRTKDTPGSGAGGTARAPDAGFESALPFIEAVVAQAAVPLGLQASDAERVEREARVAALVRTVLAEADAAAVARLRDEPVLLSAFFQNIDLLYRHAYPRADVVALLVMRTLEGLDEEPGATPGEATARGLPPA